MATSMTGFGRGSVRVGSHRFTVEAKSLNNRYIDVRVHAPREMLQLDHALSSEVRKTFHRGKFEIVLKLENVGFRSESGLFDEKLMVQKWRQLEKIRKGLKLAEPVSLEAVVSGSLISQEKTMKEAKTPDFFLKAARKAFSTLKQSRAREGRALVTDMGKRLRQIGKAVNQVATRARKGKKDKWLRLQKRVADLVGHGPRPIDSRRLEVELALIADKSDVSEEIVRLKTHLKRLGAMIRKKGPVGREMEFLLQEANREINTVGSKANDLQVTNEVVFVKSELEKIREQGQNLE